MIETIPNTHTDLADRLATALRAHERAKVDRQRGDNPFDEYDLKRMTSAGLRTGADRHPALSMAAKGALGNEMEAARFAENERAIADKAAKRKAQARARAERKVAFDKIADSDVRPDPERMAEAWLIVAHLAPTIERIASGKQRWAARHLGDVTDDVTQLTIENMALLLAKSDKDLDLMLEAAQELGDRQRETGRVPGEQLSKEERKERKAHHRARKWLMQVANNRVHSTLVDTYFRSHNLRWQNIDVIATVMANISGVGDDPMMAQFKADRAPAFLGTRFQRPGGIDSGLMAAAINAAITEKGLDRMVELLLNEDNRRVDGSFKWNELAEQVFLTSPTGDGEWMWQVICQATTGRTTKGNVWTMDRATKTRGEAARNYVRQEFEWLPNFIVSLVDAFDPQMVGFTAKSMTARNGEGRAVRLRNSHDTQVRAVLASEFELYYLPEQSEKREALVPKLRFGSVEEAALALAEHVAELVTGNELVKEV